MAQPLSLQSPEKVAEEYGGNKQKIAQAVQSGIIDPTTGLLAGMFIDRMRAAAAQEQAPTQTIAQQVFAPPHPPAPPQGAPSPGPRVGPAPPQGAPSPGPRVGPAPPQGGPAPPQGGPPPQQAPMAAAGGGLMSIPLPDTMFDEPKVEDGAYANGGIVAFDSGGKAGTAAAAATSYVPDDFDWAAAWGAMYPAGSPELGNYTPSDAAQTILPIDPFSPPATPNFVMPVSTTLLKSPTNAGSSSAPSSKSLDSLFPADPNRNARIAAINALNAAQATAAPSTPAALTDLQRQQAMNSQDQFFGPLAASFGSGFKHAVGAVGSGLNNFINAPGIVEKQLTAAPTGTHSVAPRPNPAAPTPTPAATATVAKPAPAPGAPAANAPPGAHRAAAPVAPRGPAAINPPTAPTDVNASINAPSLTDAIAAEKNAIGTPSGPGIDAFKNYLADSANRIANEKKEDFWSTLAQIGFGMAGSSSPYALQALGQSASAAMPGMQKAIETRRVEVVQDMKDQAQLDLQNFGANKEAVTAGTNLYAKQLDEFTQIGVENMRAASAERVEAMRLRGELATVGASARLQPDFQLAQALMNKGVPPDEAWTRAAQARTGLTAQTREDAIRATATEKADASTKADLQAGGLHFQDYMKLKDPTKRDAMYNSIYQSHLNRYLMGSGIGAGAPAGATQTKVLNGVTYHQINGQWVQQ